MDPFDPDPEMRERVRADLFPARESHMCCLILIGLLVVWSTLCGTGCAGPVPIIVVDSATNEQASDSPRPADSNAGRIVLEACDLLEIACEIQTDPDQRGAVVIDIIAVDSVTLGRTLHRAERPNGAVYCRPVLWAAPLPSIVAHELGHVFGLDHRPIDDPDGPDAIMSAVAGAGSSIVSDGELDTVASESEAFTRWCS
jgi:hypothetical protein